MAFASLTDLTNQIVAGLKNKAKPVTDALNRLLSVLNDGGYDVSIKALTTSDTLTLGAKMDVNSRKLTSGNNEAFQHGMVPALSYTSDISGTAPAISGNGLLFSADGALNLTPALPFLKRFNEFVTIRGFKFYLSGGDVSNYIDRVVIVGGISGGPLVDHTEDFSATHTVFFTADGQAGTPLALADTELRFAVYGISNGNLNLKGIVLLCDLNDGT